MARSATAALFGALLITAPAADAGAQSPLGFTLQRAPEIAPKSKGPHRPRIDLSRIGEDSFERVPDLFGIPLTADNNARNRERGFSFGVRPVKGVRAVARLRF